MYVQNQTNVKGYFVESNGTWSEMSNSSVTYPPSREFLKFTSEKYYNDNLLSDELQAEALAR